MKKLELSPQNSRYDVLHLLYSGVCTGKARQLVRMEKLGMTKHYMLSNLDQNLEFLKQKYSFLISVCMDKASRLVWMDRWGANKLFAQLDSATAAAATAARKAAMEN